MRNKVTDWEERNQSVDGGRFQVIGYVYLILSTFLKEHVLFLHPEEKAKYFEYSPQVTCGRARVEPKSV